MVDIPGTYSLMAHSVEEEVARDFICFGDPDAVVVVCDATCLERNMNLVLQTLEITGPRRRLREPDGRGAEKTHRNRLWKALGEPRAYRLWARARAAGRDSTS